MSQLQYSYIDDVFEKELINNQEFYTMNCTIDYMGLNIKQIYYSTVIDRFCLSVLISYATDDQKRNLEKMISSMIFKK